MRSWMSILALTSCLGLALLAAVDASAQTGDSAAAVALARETLARKMRKDPAEFDARVRRGLAGSPGRGPLFAANPREEDEDERWPAGVSASGRARTRTTSWWPRARLECATSTAVSARRRPRASSIESELAPEVDAAREDLARRLSIRPETIKVVEAVSVVWRDSSAGCPEKGMDYPQVLTPGFRIRLHVGGRPYLYHGREGGTPFLCGRPSGPEPLPAETS